MKTVICSSWLVFTCFFVPGQPVSPLVASFGDHLELKSKTPFRFQWISLGPVLNSARADAVQLDHTSPGTIYVAFGSGNLWKSTNHGNSWKPIFNNMPSQGIGDIALAPSNPSTIYLGTGESLKKPRNFTMPGTGVYRSDDGGEQWRYLGLPDSWHIGEIAVHPANPDIVFVAVLGHLWSTNENRGLYRSEDGGLSWDHVLFVDEKTGANDVVISASDPSVVYVSMWENHPGIFGPNSGIYKSDDGGDSWTRMKNGLPNGPQTGRIGLAVSYADPNKVYALIDNLNLDPREAAEIYKTEDGGNNWTRTHEEKLMIFPGIGWYFADIYTNPLDDDEIYALGVRMAHSEDGGKTFDLIGGHVFHFNPSPAQTLHLDHCELWINPSNPGNLALANDGGLYISYDKGQSWTHYNNIPAGEFYDIAVDYQDPYTIYGGVQDDATVFGPSKWWNPQFADEWKYLWIDAWSGGDGCMTFVDPDDSNTVYFSAQTGGVRRRDMAADSSLSIRPQIPESFRGKVDFNFISPFFISPHDSKTLYLGANYVFKSSDRGDNWQIISGDLSFSENPNKKSLAIGAIAESQFREGVLYAGTDKGAFWITPDGGQNWEERSNGLPDHYVRTITPSRFSRSRVYLAAPGINYDDLGCDLFVTEDQGVTWRSICSNLPDEVAYTIIEDPMQENVLYAGMLRGVYMTLDRGQSWNILGVDLPPVAVSDLIFHEKTRDLIASTHGRGIYKIDLTSLHVTLSKSAIMTEPYLFEIPPLRRPKINDTHNEPLIKTLQPAIFTYWLQREAHVTIRVNDAEGNTVISNDLIGRAGYNQWKWDLVVKKNESNLPYFIHYNEYLKAGQYQVILETLGSRQERRWTVLDGNS